uniref:Polyprotein n=1 Tax=Ascogregarina taiwanensis TaxID=158379 RepID=B3SRB8_ASCTA|nr:polyprotein [Ascogregarina taiwanensis]
MGNGCEKSKQTDDSGKQEGFDHNIAPRRDRSNSNVPNTNNDTTKHPTTPKTDQTQAATSPSRHRYITVPRVAPQDKNIGCTLAFPSKDRYWSDRSHSLIPKWHDSGDSPQQRRRSQSETVFPELEFQNRESRPLLQEGWKTNQTKRRHPDEHRTYKDSDDQIRAFDRRNQLDQTINTGSPSNTRSQKSNQTTERTGHCLNRQVGMEEIDKPKRPYNCRLITVNVNGYSVAKAVQIRNLIDKHHAEFAIITETNTRIHQQLPGMGKPFTIQGETGLLSGVAAVFPSHKPYNITSKTERIIQVLMPNKILVIGAYAPNETSSAAIKTQFYVQLNQAVSEGRKTYGSVIVLGDLNAGHEPLVGRKPAGGPNFNRLQELQSVHDLVWIETDKTWQSARTKQPTRTLDRCLIHHQQKWTANATLDWEDRIADHAVLVVSVTFNTISRDIGRPHHRVKDPTTTDDLWLAAKIELQRPQDEENTAKVANKSALTDFWNAKRGHDKAIRENLTIVDDKGVELSNQQAVEVIAAQLKELWTTEDKGQQLPPRKPITVPSDPPSEQEIKVAIGKLKRDTALGMDKISTNMLKDNEDAAAFLSPLFNYIWMSCDLPQDWKDMKIKPIPKDSSKCLASKTRPITCLSAMTKLLNNLISQRYQDKYESALHTNQHAYRTSHGIWTAKTQLIQEIKRRRQCIATFLDMSKAFDKVSRTALIEALTTWGIPDTEMELVLEQYRHANVYIELNGKKAAPFQHAVGIRQGCTLSGLIFNLCIAKAMFKVERCFAKHDFLIISYSDDIVVVANDKTTSRVVTRAMEIELKHMGLLINETKSKSIPFDIDSVANDGDSVEWLGSTLTTTLSWKAEIDKRQSQAKVAAKEIRQLCIKNQLRIPTESMVAIVQAMVCCYLYHPLDIVDMNETQTASTINLLMSTLLQNTNMSESRAKELAKELLHLQPPQKEKRKVFQSKDKPPMPAQPLLAPDQATKDRRKQEIEQLQAERHWCKECVEPTYFANIVSHRAKIHQLPPLPRLTVHCKDCQRQIDSVAYSKHVCVGEGHVEDLLECSKCQGKYGKHGMARHKASCGKVSRQRTKDALLS